MKKESLIRVFCSLFSYYVTLSPVHAGSKSSTPLLSLERTFEPKSSSSSKKVSQKTSKNEQKSDQKENSKESDPVQAPQEEPVSDGWKYDPDVVRVLIDGKISTSAIFGGNKVKGHYLVQAGKKQVIDLKGLFKDPGQFIPSKNMYQTFNVNNSQLGVRGEKVFRSPKWGEVLTALQINISGDASSSQHIREIYIEMNIPYWGLFLFGNTKGPENRSVVGPSDFMCGSGGTDGNFRNIINPTTSADIRISMQGDTGVATKVSWYTPRYNLAKGKLGSVQLGLSFTPNNRSLGEAAMNTAVGNKDKPWDSFDLRSFVQAANYQIDRDDVSFACSVAHISGSTQSNIPDQYFLERNNTNSWDVAFNTSIGALNLGSEFIWNGRGGMWRRNLGTPQTTGTFITPVFEALTPTDFAQYAGTYDAVGQKFSFSPASYDASLAGKSWLLNSAVGWITKKWGASIAYFYSSTNTGIVMEKYTKGAKAIGKAVVASFDWYLWDGFTPYIEGGIFKMTNPAWAHISETNANLTYLPFQGVPNNTCMGVLTGLKLQF